MSDVKISNLPASITPLAGTEVLPVVQGGVTKKVSVANITAGREIPIAGSNSTENYRVSAGKGLAWSGNSAVFITPEDNVQGARVAAGGGFKVFVGGGNEAIDVNSSTQNVNITNGNLVIGTSGKGIDFSATPGTGTSELLNDYEEGTFSGTFNIGGTANSTSTGQYTKVGNVVTYDINFFADPYTKSGTGNLNVTGMPFVAKTNGFYIGQVGYLLTYNALVNGTAYVELPSGSATLTFYGATTNNVANITDAMISSGTLLIRVSGTYLTN